MAAGENPGPEQGDVGSRLPDVPGEDRGGDCPHCPGNTGGPPEGHHGPYDCGGVTGGQEQFWVGCQDEWHLRTGLSVRDDESDLSSLFSLGDL